MAAAARLLERLRVAAEEGGRLGTLIEILILQALAHHAEHGRHDVPELALLERALRLAEPEGYVRVFVGEGAPMAALLEALCPHGEPAWSYPRRLLRRASVGRRQPRPLGSRPGRPVERARARRAAAARHRPRRTRDSRASWYVSLNTVRTHTKNIYAKLGVNSRRAAVTRAGELGLLCAHPVRITIPLTR